MKENKAEDLSVIHLKGLAFFGFHGFLTEEQTLGQRFVIDADIYPGRWPQGSDDIADTVNYAEVYAVIRGCVEKETFLLIESLAEELAARILRQFPCLQVRIIVHKPQAPIPGIFQDVSVEILRRRAE